MKWTHMHALNLGSGNAKKLFHLNYGMPIWLLYCFIGTFYFWITEYWMEALMMQLKWRTVSAFHTFLTWEQVCCCWAPTHQELRSMSCFQTRSTSVEVLCQHPLGDPLAAAMRFFSQSQSLMELWIVDIILPNHRKWHWI